MGLDVSPKSVLLLSAVWPAADTLSVSALSPRKSPNRIDADSDDFPRELRFDLAPDSEMISPTIPI